MKPPASSVISSMLLAMVSSVSSLPAVPSPFFSRLGDRLHVLHRLARGCRCSSAACRPSCAARSPVALDLALALARPGDFIALGDLADVLHRHLDVVGLGAGDALDVGGDVVHPLQQPLEHHRVARDQLVGVVGDLLDRARRSGPHVRRISCRIGSVVSTWSMISPTLVGLDDVLDLVAVLEHAVLLRWPFTWSDRRARIDRPGRTRPAATRTSSRPRRSRRA